MSKRKPQRRCKMCGQLNPISAETCKICQTDLMLYGEVVGDGPGTPPTPKSHSKVWLIVAAVAALILALLILLLSGLDSDHVPQETAAPTTIQTQPVQTEGASPEDTQAPETNPPATEAPETEPPATEAPETEPPATEAPETEPPATEPAFDPNTLKATIFGREEVFYLSRAYVGDYEINATYYAYNPRGEQMYYLHFSFDKNLFEGTYNTSSSILYADVKVSFSKVGSHDYYTSYPGLDMKNYNVGTFTIEKISEDWMTYDGSFNMELYLDKKDSIVIDDAVFNFTLE